MVVHTGLIQLAESPEELAGVLAHEVQHVEQRHSLLAMAQSLGLAGPRWACIRCSACWWATPAASLPWVAICSSSSSRATTKPKPAVKD